MAARKRVSKILKCTLPGDHRERIQELLEIAGSLPFHERYVNGEFREVWTELSTLGDELRFDPVAIDALAVAYEMMHRAAANVETIVKRLEAIGYQFRETAFSPYWRTSLLDTAMSARFEQLAATVEWNGPALAVFPELAGILESQRVSEEARARAAQERRMGIVRPHVQPEPLTEFRIKRVVRSAGAMPISLRAWHETVGGVNLVGSHPVLAPPGVECDPLFVAPFQFVLDRWRAWEEDDSAQQEPPPFQMPISPHRIAKAGGSANAPLYTVTLPNAGLDAIVENEPHGLHFVAYLRLAFEWGGFPGYADAPAEAPKVLASLRHGLLPL